MPRSEILSLYLLNETFQFKLEVFNLQQIIDDGKQQDIFKRSGTPKVLITLPETLFLPEGKRKY